MPKWRQWRASSPDKPLAGVSLAAVADLAGKVLVVGGEFVVPIVTLPAAALAGATVVNSLIPRALITAHFAQTAQIYPRGALG